MAGVRRVVVVVPILLVLILLLPASGSAATSSRPPADLHRVGDHWTPYNPPDPATFPADAKVHIIARGDTLWDLAQKYYGNAYLWPQLWEANTYITDAHWIYPGDPLLVEGEASGGGVATTTTLTPSETESVSETPAVTAQVTPEGTPVALGSFADVYCFGYLGSPGETFTNRIMSFEDAETKYSAGSVRQDVGVATDEIIFIEGGASTGLVAGDTYLVVKTQELVYHPKTKELVGQHYAYRGQVKILCATDDRATAIVTQACSDMHIGDGLKPLIQIPIPISRKTPMANVCSPPSGKPTGYIVNSKEMRYALGEGSLVEINLGRDDFVQPGDFLTVYRDSSDPKNPPQPVGEIGVLTSDSHTATARVLEMRYSMAVGDRVEVK